MITIPILVDGVKRHACVDTGAAADVCNREEVYRDYMNGEAIFQ